MAVEEEAEEAEEEEEEEEERDLRVRRSTAPHRGPWLPMAVHLPDHLRRTVLQLELADLTKGSTAPLTGIHAPPSRVH